MPFRTFRDLLEEKLSKKEFAFLPSSFDVIGRIIVIQLPKGLMKKKRVVGRALLEANRHAETVCVEKTARRGRFRLQEFEVIAGKKSLEALHRESGCVFRLNISRVFFSPRTTTERIRIAGQVKAGEVVAVPFAGIGPYAIVIARHASPKIVYGIELNSTATKYFRENIVLNKMQGRIEAIQGDARKVLAGRLKGKCDRIVMPLPMSSNLFLKEAMLCLKPKGGMIHVYAFGPKEKPFEKTIAEARAEAKKLGRAVRVRSKRVISTYSPTTLKACVELFVGGKNK